MMCILVSIAIDPTYMLPQCTSFFTRKENSTIEVCKK